MEWESCASSWYTKSNNMELYSTRVNGDVITEFVSGGAKNYGYKTRQESFNMDHVLWEGLYADRVGTNWCFGTKDHTRVIIYGRIPDLEFYDPDSMMTCKSDMLERSISKANALRFTLVMKRKQERQTGVVTDLARQVKKPQQN